MVVLGVGASYIRFGWLSIPFALLIPAVPTVLGAFDDGESLGLIVFWFALWPALTALGFAGGAIVQWRSKNDSKITR